MVAEGVILNGFQLTAGLSIVEMKGAPAFQIKVHSWTGLDLVYPQNRHLVDRVKFQHWPDRCDGTRNSYQK
jgi:hypothetical protein